MMRVSVASIHDWVSLAAKALEAGFRFGLIERGMSLCDITVSGWALNSGMALDHRRLIMAVVIPIRMPQSFIKDVRQL